LHSRAISVTVAGMAAVVGLTSLVMSQSAMAAPRSRGVGTNGCSHSYSATVHPTYAEANCSGHLVRGRAQAGSTAVDTGWIPNSCDVDVSETGAKSASAWSGIG
jgi:hypothetical protein